MRTITRDDVLTALDEAVAEKGADYVYPRRTTENSQPEFGGGCDYVRDGAPSCIAANALHRLGVPVETLQILDHLAPGGVGIDTRGVPAVLRAAGFEPGSAYDHHGALGTLRKAQCRQDQGVAWGEAAKAAHEADY